MGIKIYKPTTAARRKSSVNDFTEITATKPQKSLLRPYKKKAGRNAQGKITVRHRGGGAKRKYRLIDFNQDKFGVEGVVKTIEYDPNRSAWIALISYNDGDNRYVLALDKMKVGQIILTSKERTEVQTGNRMPLKVIPIGTPVCNIELTPGKGGSMVRSAGSSAQLMAVEGKYALLKLPSKEVRKVSADALATVGAISNIDHRLVRIGKAGRMRHRGIRPTVRGKAMNPVDHPHGGGEGSNPIGMKAPKTKWGKKALGVKTRKKKKRSSMFIVQRRKKRKK